MGSKRGIFLSFLGKLPFLGSQGQIAKLRRGSDHHITHQLLDTVQESPREPNSSCLQVSVQHITYGCTKSKDIQIVTI